MRNLTNLFKTNLKILLKPKPILTLLGASYLFHHYKDSTLFPRKLKCQEITNPKTLRIPRAIPLFDPEEVLELLAQEEQEFHLVILNHLTQPEAEAETEARQIKNEVDLLKKRDKLKVFVYRASSTQDFDQITRHLNQHTLIKHHYSRQSVILSKRLFNKKPKIFCGNNSKIKLKLADFFRARPRIDKFSTFVFYSSVTLKKEVRDKVHELKQKYPSVHFVNTAELGWTKSLSTNKIVIIKKKSKYVSLSNDVITLRDRKTYLKEFTVDGQTFQWLPAHACTDNVDEMMDKFGVFSQRGSFDDWETKKLRVQVRVNRNRLSSREFHSILSLCKQSKEYALKYRPEVCFTLEFTDEINGKIDILAEDLQVPRVKNSILQRTPGLDAPYSQEQKEALGTWNRSGLYKLDADLRTLTPTKLQGFLDDIACRKWPMHTRRQASKPHSRIERIGYLDMLNLSNDGSKKDALVFVYAQKCPACNAVKPILSKLSLLSTAGVFKNVRFFKIDSEANFGFYSTPVVYYVKYGVDDPFLFKRKMRPLTLEKNLFDFVFVPRGLEVESQGQFPKAVGFGESQEIDLEKVNSILKGGLVE